MGVTKYSKMVFCAGFRHKNDELASELCEIISTLRDDFGDNQMSLIDSISCIENIATELTQIENIESKTKTKNDLQAKLDDLKENTDKTTAKVEEANLELEQVQEINKNKHAQNEAYIERTNRLKTILSTLNQDTAQMLLDKTTLKDREIKLKQDAIESSSIYEVEKQNQDAEIESLKSQIEMIWDENSKRFINLLETKISTLVDSHFMPDGDHPDSNSLKPPEMITKSRSPRAHVSRSSTTN